MPVAYVVSSGPSGSRRQRAMRVFGMSLKRRQPPRHTGPSVNANPPATRSMGASGAIRSCRLGSFTSSGDMISPLRGTSGTISEGTPQNRLEMMLMLRARMAVLKTNESTPWMRASLRIRRDVTCTSDTWQVIPITKEK